MRSHRKTTKFILLAGLISSFAITMVALPSQSNNASNSTYQIKANQKDSQETKMAIAIYNGSGSRDSVSLKLRQIRSSRYDAGKPKNLFVAEPSDATEELPLNVHFWLGLPALPVTHSDAVILGDVISTNAYLSNDKTGIYSEFTVRIEGVLKNFDYSSLHADDSVAVEREGGAVQFPSGRIQHYRINKQGMPTLHHRYVFFLKYNEQGQDFSIVTGYELNKGRTSPLDDVDPYTIYEKLPEDAFLKIVRDAIVKSPQQGGQVR